MLGLLVVKHNAANVFSDCKCLSLKGAPDIQSNYWKEAAEQKAEIKQLMKRRSLVLERRNHWLGFSMPNSTGTLLKKTNAEGSTQFGVLTARHCFLRDEPSGADIERICKQKIEWTLRFTNATDTAHAPVSVVREEACCEEVRIPAGASSDGNDWAWFGLSREAVADAIVHLGGEENVYNLSVQRFGAPDVDQQVHMFSYAEIGKPLFCPIYSVMRTAKDRWQHFNENGDLALGQMKATILPEYKDALWVDGLGDHGECDGYFKGRTHAGASGAALWSDEGLLLGVNNHQGRAVTAQHILSFIA